MRRGSSTTLASAVDPETTARGARVVVEKCLVPARGERVHLLSFRAGGITKIFERALREAGAPFVPVELDGFGEDAPVAELVARLEPLLASATAVIFCAPVRPPQTLSLSVAKVAESTGARMLYLLQVDERLLAQSARAEPELLATVNQRVIAALAPPTSVHVTSEAGTDLTLSLSEHHPVLEANGRPGPGQSENLPAGYVYVHPARVSGTLVVDRAMFGPKGDVGRATLRRAPVRVEFVAGRVARHDATGEAKDVLLAYLASHAQAARVGLVVLPTNYLVRAEIGADRQDMLLPGLTVSLGFANASKTGATYEAPVQLVLLGRQQTVRTPSRTIIDAGRFDASLAQGIDPFR